MKPTDKSPRRGEFWSDYNNYGIQFILKKYAPQPSILRRAVRKFKVVLKGGVEVVRYRSIDALRMLCAFMIVCIHIPSGNLWGGGYWIAVCRIAVPIFLMISGYFYNKESAIKQIKKIGFLFIEANLLYGVWSCFYGVVSGVYPIINGNSDFEIYISERITFLGTPMVSWCHLVHTNFCVHYRPN